MGVEFRENVESACTMLCAVGCGVILAAAAAGQDWATKMTWLNNPNADGLTWKQGIDDWYPLPFYAMLLTVLRKASMRLFWIPLGACLGVTNEVDLRKFQQQGWVWMYYTASWTWGFYELYQSEYFFDREALWMAYPQGQALPTSFKLYLTISLAFWFHMVFVTTVEPWQGDFAVHIVHHFCTILLMAGAYYLSLIRVAHAIIVCMDTADIFLPAAKVCNYVAAGEAPKASRDRWQALADVLFAVFAVVWMPTRHGILPAIYLIILDGNRTWLIGFGPNEDRCNCGAPNGACVLAPDAFCNVYPGNFESIRRVFIVLLGLLQVCLLIWLKDISVAVYQVIAGGGTVAGVEEKTMQNIPELEQRKKSLSEDFDADSKQTTTKKKNQ